GLLGLGLLPLPYANGAVPRAVDGRFKVVVGTAANGCAEDLDRLARKVEENYAGFALELQGSARAAYDARLARSRREAARAQGPECFLVLRDFVSRFEDPHLFIFQSTRMDSAETARLARSVESRPIDEREVRRYLDSRSDLLDPVEGIWFDHGLRVAVLADSATPGTFVAIVLSPDSSTWKRGDVRARLTRARDGGYE